MEIDLPVLIENHGVLRDRIGSDVALFVSVKANAYGHGAVEVARALRGRDIAGYMVSSVSEARVLRDAGIHEKIVCFSGEFHEASAYGEYDITPTVCTVQEAQVLARAAENEMRVWVEVDVGFGRFGADPDHVDQLVDAIGTLPRLSLEGVYAHLPFEDERGRVWAESCHRIFDQVVTSIRRRGTHAGRGMALVQGRRVGVMRVSTASMVLAIAGCERPSIGDEVVLLGSQGDAMIGLTDVAEWSGITPLECVLSWNQRLPHVFLR